MDAEAVLEWFAEEVANDVADSIASATDRRTSAKVGVFACQSCLFHMYEWTVLFSIDIFLTSYPCSSAGREEIRSKASMYDTKGDRGRLLEERHQHQR